MIIDHYTPILLTINVEILILKNDCYWTFLMFLFVDKPTAPQDLKPSEVTADSITLTWQTPADNGGSEILEYIIEKKEFNRRTWQQMGTTKDLTFTIPKLLEGNQYFFKVAARNDIGIGEAAETKEAITAKNPFGMCKTSVSNAMIAIHYLLMSHFSKIFYL